MYMCIVLNMYRIHMVSSRPVSNTYRIGSRLYCPSHTNYGVYWYCTIIYQLWNVEIYCTISGLRTWQHCHFLRFHSTIMLNVFLFHFSEIKKGIQYRGELADHGSSWWAFSEAITGCLFFYMAIQTYRHTSHLFVSLFYFRIEKNNWTHSIL